MDKVEQISKIERLFRQKREAATDLARANYDKACTHPPFAENEKTIREQELAVGRALHENKNVEEERTKLNSLYRKRLRLLEEIGMNKNHLIPQYQCPLCKDVGIINGKHCKCFDNALFELLSETAHLKDAANLADLHFSQDNNKKVAAYIKKYAKSFNFVPQKNILLVGKTGTGKTYLLRALAAELLKQRNSVFFLTAFQLNRIFLKIHAGTFAEKDTLLDSLLDADILVVDDLGSEQIYKNVTLEYLFNIINERQIDDKATFFTTNCSLEELKTRYTERIFSRLANPKVTAILQLDNDDLRLQLKV